MDQDVESTPGSGQVAAALRAMSEDPGSRDRLALTSVLSKNGELWWELEIVYHVWRNGGTAYRQSSVGGLTRVDLVVADEAFQVKSKIWDYTTITTLEGTIDWFAEDVDSLGRGTVPGHQLITIATLIDAVNVRFPSPGSRGWIPDRTQERMRAIDLYRRYSATVTEVPPVHIDLGVGTVPTNRGTVHLDAFIIGIPQKHAFDIAGSPD